MRLCICGLTILLGCAATLRAKGSPQRYMRRAEISHHQAFATVQADSGRPLLQAITAVREGYGWVVDYEDPPYSGTFDLVRDSSMCRRPCGKGFLVPSGGAFSSTYPETPQAWSSTDSEFQVLDKIVSDYSATQNPGKFALREQVDGSYAVVGESIESNGGGEIPVHPILDTPISIPRATRTADATVALIVGAVGTATGTRLGIGTEPLNLFFQAKVTVGGTDVPARDLLLETLDQITSAKVVWELLFDPDGRAFYLNLLPAERVHYNLFGQRTMTIVR